MAIEMIEAKPAGDGVPGPDQAPVQPPPTERVEERRERDDDPEKILAQIQEQLERSKRETERERTARAEAERQHASARAEADSSRQLADQSQLDSIAAAIEARKQIGETLQSELEAAWTNGNFKDAASLQRRLARAEAEVAQLESGKMAWEQNRAARVREAPAERPATTPAAEREAFLARVHPRSADWIRNHPEFFTDQKFQKRVTGAAQFLEGEGLSPSEDDYYARIETMVGLRSSDGELPRDGGPRQDRGRAPVSAPVSRSAPSYSGERPRAAGNEYIPPEARRAAEVCGVDPVQYWDEYKRLLKEDPRQGKVFG